jgi:hypothetical protein
VAAPGLVALARDLGERVHGKERARSGVADQPPLLSVQGAAGSKSL